MQSSVSDIQPDLPVRTELTLFTVSFHLGFLVFSAFEGHSVFSKDNTVPLLAKNTFLSHPSDEMLSFLTEAVGNMEKTTILAREKVDELNAACNTPFTYWGTEKGSRVDCGAMKVKYTIEKEVVLFYA